MQATYKVLDIARDRRKILEKEIEKRKIKSKNNKYFFTFTFLYGKIYILCYKIIFGKTLFILLHLRYSFFTWPVIGNLAIKHQSPYKYMQRFCRRSNSTQNTWQQTRYFNVDFDSNGLFLFYILEKYLQFRKDQKHLLEKMFGSPHTSNRIYFYCSIVFKRMYSSKTCT